MLVIESISELRKILISKNGQKIGFVPTMGALHDGHLELVKQSLIKTDFTVVSIFVNPIQFGPKEDFNKYPRVLENDTNLLKGIGTHLVFCPKVEDMYPADRSILITESKLSTILCGKHRTGHFDGVCTVVAKFFNMVKPDYAFFGEKDYQQLCVIKQLVRDLNFDINIVGIPIVREPDGLALSSRNQYLSIEERNIASSLYRMLLSIAETWRCSPATDSSILVQIGTDYLSNYPAFKLQYLEFRDPITLNEINGPVPLNSRLLVAAYLGSTRLIDNIGLR